MPAGYDTDIKEIKTAISDLVTALNSSFDRLFVVIDDLKTELKQDTLNLSNKADLINRKFDTFRSDTNQKFLIIDKRLLALEEDK